MIRLAEEKDFAQLAEMRWQHAAWPSDNSVDWYLRNEFSSQNDVLMCGL